jgi:hypothetical protein
MIKFPWSLSETRYSWRTGANRPMVQLLRLLCGALIGLFRSSARHSHRRMAR